MLVHLFVVSDDGRLRLEQRGDAWVLVGEGAARFGLVDEYLAHPKLSVTDIYLTALAHSTGATPLYTFDKKLAAQLNGAELA